MEDKKFTSRDVTEENRIQCPGCGRRRKVCEFRYRMLSVTVLILAIVCILNAIAIIAR